MPSEEFAAMGFLTAKAGREDECSKLAKELTQSTNREDAGCIYYAILRKTDNPREFALHERWKDMASLRSHLQRLKAVYGEPAAGAPPGSLPAAIAEPFEKIQFFAPFKPVD